MGYYTRYEFTNVSEATGPFYDALWEIVGGKISDDEPCKWYEHTANIQTAMVQTGTDAVDLHGAGEEQGDVWDKEFRLSADRKRVHVKTYRYRLVRDVNPLPQP